MSIFEPIVYKSDALTHVTKRKSTKMKELLMVVSLLLSGVVTEPPAPYPPSGWRPSGPAFELPQSLPPPEQQYLPVDPRRPLTPNDFDENVDVSVQGLPVPEQEPIFQVSPINGQQYTGPSINSDIRNLNPSLQQAQYRQQLEKARQFARQREFEANNANAPSNGLPNQQSPRQFVFQTRTTTTTTTTQKPETTTDFNSNEEEDFDDGRKPIEQKQKVSVEVSKQNIQEYPPELFLSPLTQLANSQAQFISLAQLGQLRAPVFFQQTQAAPATQGFDGPAHFSALPSVLAQRELLNQQPLIQNQGFTQNPIVVQQEQSALVQEPLNQYQPIIAQYQPQAFPQFAPQADNVQVLNQPNQFAQQPDQFLQPQQQNLFVQPQQPSQFAQTQPQPQFVQPQPNQFIQPQQPNQYTQPQQPNQFIQPQQSTQFIQSQQPNQFIPPQQPNLFAQPQKPKDVEEIEQNDQQVVYQNYQPQFYQPQQPANQYQNPDQPLFLAQPALNYQDQGQIYPNQFIPQQYDPSQFQQVQPQQVFRDQNALQSGLDINQAGNGIEEEETDDNQEATTKATVATAFGTRTQPRVFAQYGAPNPAQEDPTTTTEPSNQEESEIEEGPAVAQATAVATGRRNARLRSRRIRPVFTLDRSGHLVLAQNQ